MEEKKESRIREIKEKILEVLEGGLRGNTAARIFSWTLIILIILSVFFLIVEDREEFEPYVETFEVIETVTIGIFTMELILGFWTADVRFEGDPHPRLRYATSFMTIVQFLAILPFYMGLVLNDIADYWKFAEYFQLLKLLHLLKIGELGVHAYKERKEEKRNEKSSEDDSLPSE